MFYSCFILVYPQKKLKDFTLQLNENILTVNPKIKIGLSSAFSISFSSLNWNKNKETLVYTIL